MSRAKKKKECTAFSIFKASLPVAGLSTTEPGFDVFIVQLDHASAVPLGIFISIRVSKVDCSILSCRLNTYLPSLRYAAARLRGKVAFLGSARIAAV